MDDLFTISFSYKGRQYDLETKFVRVGYVHQFHLQFDGRTLIFEFDEEREYRVIDASSSPQSGLKNIDVGLLEMIVDKISSLH